MPSLVGEQEQVAAQRIVSEPRLHQAEQAVVAFAEIDRLWIREHAYGSGRAEDHPSARSSAAASVSDRPSIRKPSGETMLTVRTLCSGTTFTGRS